MVVKTEANGRPYSMTITFCRMSESFALHLMFLLDIEITITILSLIFCSDDGPSLMAHLGLIMADESIKGANATLTFLHISSSIMLTHGDWVSDHQHRLHTILSMCG